MMFIVNKLDYPGERIGQLQNIYNTQELSKEATKLNSLDNAWISQSGPTGLRLAASCGWAMFFSCSLSFVSACTLYPLHFNISRVWSLFCLFTRETLFQKP